MGIKYHTLQGIPFFDNLKFYHFKGTLYIEEVIGDNAFDQMNETGQKALFSFYGYKFETMSTTKDKDESLLEDEEKVKLLDLKRDLEITDTHEQYCSVIKTRLGCHSIVLAAEIDCVDSSNRIYGIIAFMLMTL